MDDHSLVEVGSLRESLIVPIRADLESAIVGRVSRRTQFSDSNHIRRSGRKPNLLLLFSLGQVAGCGTCGLLDCGVRIWVIELALLTTAAIGLPDYRKPAPRSS